MKSGIELIAIERHEQLEKHGRTIANDVKFNNHFQLSQGASLLLYVDPEELEAEESDEFTGYDFSHCCPQLLGCSDLE